LVHPKSVKSVLNELSDGSLTTSDGKLFHTLTIVQLKKYFLKS